MVRDIDQLSARTFDVLVVGAGVYGLIVACDAAQRGLSVALIDRGDFGSGSSFNHLRTIHGGLRYLQTLDIPRARESVRERAILARIAPHAVRPLPFVLPIFRSLTRGATAMRAGFALDAFVARDRNRGVPAGLQLPAGRVISAREAGERFPSLESSGATGAAVWHDYITPESDRLTLSWALAAEKHSAVLANYVEAVALLKTGGRVDGARARDLHGDRELEIRAHVTINATGGSVDGLLTLAGFSTGLPLLKAMNLVTRRTAGPEALGGRSASGRNLFMVPWHGRAIFGTWESARSCGQGDAAPTPGEVAAFLEELNQAFPAMKLAMEDVGLVHRGLVPAVAMNGRLSLEGHERVWDHSTDGIEGIISVAGTKYTTARAVAERVTDTLVAKLKRQVRSCRTAATPLPGGGHGVIEAASLASQLQVPSDTAAHLAAAFGSDARKMVEAAAGHPAARVRLSNDSPVIGAELLWAVREEMALTLCDAAIRRTPLGALGYPGDDAAKRAAQIVGDELGWSPEKRREERAALKEFYRIG